MACRIIGCSCSLCPHCGTTTCPEFNKHIERYWVYATDKKGSYLISQVQVDDLKSLKTRLKKLCCKKNWAKKFIFDQRVEITITDGRYSWYDSIRVYLNIENGILYTKDNKVWNWKLEFVEN